MNTLVLEGVESYLENRHRVRVHWRSQVRAPRDPAGKVLHTGLYEVPVEYGVLHLIGLGHRPNALNYLFSYADLLGICHDARIASCEGVKKPGVC